MATFLQKVLQARQPLFSLFITHAEKQSGMAGIDVRYMADITHRAHHIMRRLGLDPADTTGLELYKSLNAHIDNHTLFEHAADVALLIGKDVISFNPDDVSENVSKPYEARIADNARHEIASQLVSRYAGSNPARKKMLTKELADAGVNLSATKKKPAGSHVETPYVLCIGDIFSDTFIKLNETEAKVTSDSDGNKWLSVPFGSKPPYDEAETVTSVGPSPNAAVSIARLGLRVGLMSWLGDDKVSKDSLAYLSKEKIDTVPVISSRGAKSSVYYVLRYGADRTILVKNEAYTYRWITPKTKPDWIYLSLLSPDSWSFHQDLADYLEANPNIAFAFQPGTFHFKWGAEKLKRLYGRAHIVVMNREEAVDVTKGPYDSVHELAERLHALGPKIVVITDGPNGSYASYDGKLVQVPNYPDPAPPLDRTGAGDAFASTIVAALALGQPVDIALTWAPINSMSVVQKLGAQAGLLTASQVEKYLKQAPKNYHAKEIKE